jgi:hypothetical protein
MKLPASRRYFLKGATLGAGSVVLQPILQKIGALAAGQPDKPPKRVVFIIESNGLFSHHVQPKTLEAPKYGADKLIDVSLKGHDLPDPIAALTPFKDRLTIIKGLSGRIAEGGTGGHSTNYGALGCYPGNKGPMAQTIDSALADIWPGVIPHIGLGLHNRIETNIYYGLSAVGPGKPLPIQCQPQQAYRSLFGSVAAGAGRQEFELRTNLLDFMADDVRRAKRELSGDNRDKLERYLEAFEALRDRQAKITGIREPLQKCAPNPDKFQSTVETDRLEGQFDLAAAALIAGLTNVVTLTSGGGGQHYITFTGLGIPIDGHAIGHGQGVNGKSPEECRVVIREFHARLIARLAEKLQAVPEGAGTVLDNTLIVYLSDSGESHHPDLKTWPMVLLGNMGGALKAGAGGRLLEFPSYQKSGHRTVANLWLALLHAAGRPRDTFGALDPGLRDLNVSGPLTELLA